MDENIEKKKATVVDFTSVKGKKGKSKGKGAKIGPIKGAILTVIFAALYFYFALPAINLQDPDFYWFFIITLAFYCIVTLMTTPELKTETDPANIFKTVKKVCKWPLYACIALIVIFLIGTLVSSVIFRSGSYSELLEVRTGDFSTEVEEADFDQIPMLDKDSAERLGDRKMGELSDMVSQFEVNDDYSQINLDGTPVRVATLRYGDIFKWFNNMSEGLPAYIVIDMVTQNVEVVRLDEGMKYSMYDYFGRNLNRHLRFSYPTFIFDEPNFEIDDDGNPWWIVPKLEKTIGLFGGTDANGAVLVNAITGESQYYEQVPEWVDRVYSAELIIEQYNYYGQYQSGFLNSLFGQQGVTVTTSGSNYLAMNDDVYVYTGITSVGGDQSNLGFILTNQRTKETSYYPVAGAEEYSARYSAEGKVQHLGYASTFPLLLNVSGQPTYFMSLKDNAGLVKMFAMVNVQQYTIVATGTTIEECEEEYYRLLLENDVTEEVVIPQNTVSGRVSDIRTAVIEGNSYYYFMLDNDGLYYAISAADDQMAIIINVGDNVDITTGEFEGEIAAATSIKLK